MKYCFQVRKPLEADLQPRAPLCVPAAHFAGAG